MDKQINLMDLLRLYMRRWWCLVVAMIIGGLLSGLFTTFFITPMYVSGGSLYAENTTDIVTTTTDINLSEVMVRQELVKTYAEVLTSNVFMKKVATTSGLGYNHEQILKMVSMTDKSNTEILVITVTSANPQHAYIIAQTIINLASEQIMAIVEGGNVKILDEPEYPQFPSSPNMVRNVEIGVFAGLLISLILVFAIEMLDNKVKDAETIAEIFKYPVLGEVPYFTTNTKEKKQKKKKTKGKKDK
ncbi:MAG: hypothetical protein IJC10_02735 [Clostridia bacterium]|nr:hypothetical protein [Clostridia bacterium]